MSLYSELRRRYVFRVAAAYVIIGWLTLQVADVVLGFTGAPDWVGKTLIALLLLGFIPALALAWVFEIGPNGIRVDTGASESEGGSGRRQSRRFDLVTLVAVFFILFMLVAWEQLGPALRGSKTRVDAPAEPAPPAPRRTPPPIEAPLVPEGSIAVLPFTNRSAEPDTAFFVDGVHDDLLTQLSRNAALMVISRTSVMEYRDTRKNLRQIAEELGVAHVLEGAVQRSGQRVRINAQLIDARTDAHLWAETFDRELSPESVFDIQSEIAVAIAAALNRQLGLADPTPPDAHLPTRNAEAYDLYLRARVTRADTSGAATRARLALYQQALQADPEFARAMGELGREHTNLFWYTTRRDADRKAGRQWIDRALALAPDEPQLRLALAEFHYRAYLDYDAALAELEKAERGLPGSADVAELRGYIQRRAGRIDKTLDALNAAARLDPRSPTVLATLMETHLLQGQLDAAEAWAIKLRGIPDAPRYQRWLFHAGYRAQWTGETADALAESDRMRAESGQLWEPMQAAHDLRLATMTRAPERIRAVLEAMPGDRFEDQFHHFTRPMQHAVLAGIEGAPQQQAEHAQAALELAEELLGADPDDYRAWTEKALALAMLGRGTEVQPAIERALATPLVERDVLLHAEVRWAGLHATAFVAGSAEVAREMERYLELPMKYWGFDGLVTLPAFDRHREHPAIQALARRYSLKAARA
jgi:TolB-like protein/Flp pilus assembly protein TadD